MPDDLIRAGLLTKAQPLALVPDLQMGFDAEAADMTLAAEAALPAGAWGTARRRLFRFRVDSFVEAPAGAPLPLTRGLPPGPEPTAANLVAGALAGARYLVAQLTASGRYVYQRDLTSGRGSNPTSGPYSIPRHAGTTYFLAEAYRLTAEPWLREPIERAFAHLEELIDIGGCSGTSATGAPFQCVVDQGQTSAGLGATALTVVALVEYQRATGDARYLPLAQALGEWLLFMQRADGSFTHRYDLGSGARDAEAELLYYSGEAALALARLHAVTKQERYAAAAERALDWLVGWYDFFLGGYFFHEEHWTCIAAEAIYPAVKKPAYQRFCSHYAAFLREQQRVPGAFGAPDDWIGAYGFTPFLVPHTTPAGSRTEAMISTYLLEKHHGVASPALLAQIRAALGFVLAQQIRPSSAFATARAAHAEGAVPATPVDRTVRIDYVQHVGSAMLRAAALLEPTAP